MKIKNWEIKEVKNGLGETIYQVFENLEISYYHETFLTISRALQYIAERIKD